ncbi:MAG: DUF4286 family protein [Paludibacteraceae bacterium]|nr:DUF4286 family protein [Paludibacteraceae bacterium]MBO7636233.1 DUF4286 family protein [Paludibacteraceae bacterium]MBR5972032.1 DUF4286 family protein [Paludibacteraceae bacterium]
MILFNTTYLVAPEVEKRFLYWLSSELTPEIKATGLISNIRLFKVLTDEKDGISYSFQLEAESISEMNEFKKHHLTKMETEVSNTFGERVLFFCTYLKQYEL